MQKYIACAIDAACNAVRAKRPARQKARMSGGSAARIEGLEPRLFLSTTVPAGAINTPTEWTAANSPYMLSGGVTIQPGGDLTIDPGVTVTGGSLTVASGGSVSANTVNFQSPFVAQAGSTGSITDSTFNGTSEFDLTSLTISSDVFNATPTVDPSYVPNLANNGNTFLSGTVVDVEGASLATQLTWPVIPDVASYDILATQPTGYTGGMTIASGGELTISSGVTVTGATLTVASGATLTADTVDFQCPIDVQTGSLGSISNSTLASTSEFDLTLLTISNDVFNGNPTVDPSYVSDLASGGNTFAAGTIIQVEGATLSGSVTWPNITDVSSYNVLATGPLGYAGGATVGTGGSLSIQSGVIVTGAPLMVASGGTITAIGATFDGSVKLASGSLGELEYDTFVGANSLVIDGESTVSIHNNDFSNASTTVASQGTGGPINLEMNWWGVTTAPQIAAKVSDASPLPATDFTNWLTAAPVLSGLVIETQPASVSTSVGEGVSFTAAAAGTPAPTVQWQVSTNGGTTYTNIAGATADTYSFTAAAIQNGDLFQAVFTNTSGSVTTNPATLTVAASAIPIITEQPASQSVPLGESVSFVAAATGSTVPTVQWQISSNGGAFTNIAGATSDIYTFAPGLLQSGDLFRAIFTNANGSIATTAAELTVTNTTVPEITGEPSDEEAEAGQLVSFTAAATGMPVPIVQWQVSSDGGTTYSNIPGAMSPTYEFFALAEQDGEMFQAVFSNSSGSATTSSAQLIITATPTAIITTTQPVQQTVADGQDVTFTATSNRDATGVQWQVSIDDGAFTDIPGATSATYTFAATSAEDGDEFRAVFSNSTNSAPSDPAELIVISTDTGIVINASPVSQTAPAGQSVTFIASANATSVQWQISADGGTTYTNILNATSLSYTFTPTVSQNGDLFRAVLTNSLGSVVTASATLTVTATIVAPTTTISAPAVSSAGGNGQTITVTYTSSSAINTATIAPSNITITGPNNQILIASVFNIFQSTDEAIATYTVTPPNGTWRPADNGTYSVVVNAGAVRDVNGVDAAGATSSFTVQANTQLVVGLTASPTPGTNGQSDSFTATLTDFGGGVVPTGSVTFFANGIVIGTAPVTVSGTATLVASATLTSQAVIAVYNGDATHPAASSGLPLLAPSPTPLAVTPSLSGLLPALIIAGAKTSIVQTLSITNVSGTLYHGPLKIRIFLSSQTTVDSSAILLRSTTRAFRLRNENFRSLRLRLTKLPATVPAGTYYFVVELQGADGRTSTASSSVSVVVTE